MYVTGLDLNSQIMENRTTQCKIQNIDLLETPYVKVATSEIAILVEQIQKNQKEKMMLEKKCLSFENMLLKSEEMCRCSTDPSPAAAKTSFELTDRNDNRTDNDMENDLVEDSDGMVVPENFYKPGIKYGLNARSASIPGSASILGSASIPGAWNQEQIKEPAMLFKNRSSRTFQENLNVQTKLATDYINQITIIKELTNKLNQHERQTMLKKMAFDEVNKQCNKWRKKYMDICQLFDETKRSNLTETRSGHPVAPNCTQLLEKGDTETDQLDLNNDIAMMPSLQEGHAYDKTNVVHSEEADESDDNSQNNNRIDVNTITNRPENGCRDDSGSNLDNSSCQNNNISRPNFNRMSNNPENGCRDDNGSTLRCTNHVDHLPAAFNTNNSQASSATSSTDGVLNMLRNLNTERLSVATQVNWWKFGDSKFVQTDDNLTDWAQNDNLNHQYQVEPFGDLRKVVKNRIEINLDHQPGTETCKPKQHYNKNPESKRNCQLAFSELSWNCDNNSILNQNVDNVTNVNSLPEISNYTCSGKERLYYQSI